jgi:hypothetical protein
LGALLRLEVDMDDAEALLVAVSPFKVIQQAPDEITPHRSALGEVHDAPCIEALAACAEDVIGRAAILRDVDGLGFQHSLTRRGPQWRHSGLTVSHELAIWGKSSGNARTS